MIVVWHAGTDAVGPYAPRRGHYFSCTDCGWVAPLRESRLAAVLDARKHAEVKAATRDEAR